MRLGVIGASVIVLALGAVGAARPARGDHSPFVGPQIYSVGVDGSGRRNLSQGRGQDDRLARSPNGRTLAFVRWRPEGNLGDGIESLWTMESDGSRERLLFAADDPRCGQCLGKPAWSPDGGRLVALIGAGRSAGLWVVDAASGAARRIAAATDRFGDPPSWSPDSRWMAFHYADPSTCGPGAYTNCAEWSVRVVRADGTGLRVVAKKAAEGRWAPNGRWIAYRITDGGESLGLAVVRPDGRANHRVYPARLRISAVGAFRWSPFGQLVFKTSSGRLLAALPNRRGVLRTKLVGFPTEGYFEWSPTGRRIAAIWSPNSRTSPQIWLQNADGTGRRRVTSESHQTEIPGGPFLRDLGWSRGGERLFYVY